MIRYRYLLLALLLVPAAGHAAAKIVGLPKPEKTALAEQDTAQISAIAMADVPLRIGRDQRLLQEMTARAKVSSRQLVPQDELISLKRHSNDLMQQINPASLQQLPISGLQAQERHLQFVNRELALWQGGLQSALKPLSEDMAQLTTMNAAWQQTLAEQGAIMAPALRQRIEALIHQAEQAERTLSEPLSALLQLGYDAGQSQNRVTRALAQVGARIDAIDRGLWRMDSLPLHQVLRAPQSTDAGASRALSSGLKAELAFIKEYDRVHQNRTYALIVLALLLLPLFLWLSQQAKASIASNPRLADYRKSLTRPISAWLLVTLLLLLVLQFTGPALRLKLLLILAWLPVMRLLPAQRLQAVANWMYLTAAFFLINLFAEAVSVQPLLFRLVLLGNGLLMLTAVLVLLWQSARRFSLQPTPLQWALRALAALASGLLAIALIANLAGNVTLAAMLTDATLNSAYLGLFLFAVGIVLRAFSRFLLRSVIENLKSHTQHASGLVPVVSRLFDLALILFWGYGTLGGFRLLRPLRESVSSLSELSFGFGTLSVTLGGIVLFLVSVYLSFWLARTLRGVLSEDILPNMDLPRGVANSISSLSYYALLILGLMVALAAAGFHISQLAIVLGALSVGIGLGLQDVVKNFVSGLILMV